MTFLQRFRALLDETAGDGDEALAVLFAARGGDAVAVFQDAEEDAELLDRIEDWTAAQPRGAFPTLESSAEDTVGASESLGVSDMEAAAFARLRERRDPRENPTFSQAAEADLAAAAQAAIHAVLVAEVEAWHGRRRPHG